jgi:4-hydroxybenzoate polyprenyltransferase
MIKNHLIMMINAIILIALGVYGYIISASPTALIAPAVGIILLALAIPTKKENSTMAHIAVGLTFIASVTFIIVGIRRANALVIAMGIISFICFDLYVLNFIMRKKQKEEAKQVSQ